MVQAYPGAPIVTTTPTTLQDGVQYHYTHNDFNEPYADGASTFFHPNLTIRVDILDDGNVEGRNAAGVNVGEVVLVTVHTSPNETNSRRNGDYTEVISLTISDIPLPPDVVYKIGERNSVDHDLSTNSILEAVRTTVSVRLNAAPSGDVTLVPEIPDSGFDSTRVSFPETANLRFTAANWQTFQALPVLVSRDGYVDTTGSFAVRLQGTSTDPAFSGIIEPALFFSRVLNTDPYGFAFSFPGTLTITVGVDPVTVQVSLQSRLAQSDGVAYSIFDAGRGSGISFTNFFTSVPSFIFLNRTLGNGHHEFVVTPVAPGAVTLVVGGATPALRNIYSESRPVIKVLADSQFFQVTPRDLSGFDFREGPEADGSTNSETVMVQLTGEPTSNVTVSLVLNAAVLADISVSDNDLVFTPGNWNVAQPAILSLIDDGLVETQKEVTVTYQAHSADTGFDGKSTTQSFSLKDRIVSPSIAFHPAPLPIIEEGEMLIVTLSLSHGAADPVIVDIWTENNYAEVRFGMTNQQVRVSGSQIVAGIRATIASQQTTYTVTVHTADDEYWSGIRRSYRLGAAVKSGSGAYAILAQNPLANENRIFANITNFVTGYAFASGTVEEDDPIVSSNPEELILRKGTAVTFDWQVLARRLPGLQLRNGVNVQRESTDVNMEIYLSITLSTVHGASLIGAVGSSIFLSPYFPADGVSQIDYLFIQKHNPDDPMPQFAVTARVLPLYPKPVDVRVSLALRGPSRLFFLPVEQRVLTLVAGWVTDPELQLVPKTLPTLVEGSSTPVAFHLGEPPSSAVTVGVSAVGATFDTSEFVFSTSNWNTPRNLMITAVEDGVVETDEVISITYTISSTDADYNGKTPTQALTVEDNPVTAPPGLVLDPDSLEPLAEGATSMVMVSLGSVPTANVNVAVASSDTSELTVPTANLVFTADSWNMQQAVVLTGVADNLVDGTKQVLVTFTASSTDTGYNTLPAETRSLDVTDRDTASFTFDPATLPIIAEGGTAAVTVRLDSAAEGGVTLAFTSLNPAAATLTAATIPATLTTTGQEARVTLFAIPNDIETPGNVPYGLRVSVTSDLGAYDGLTLTISRTVTDDDVANLSVRPSFLTYVPEGNASLVMLGLTSEPTANVTVSISSSDTTEAAVSHSRLVFTPTTWDTEQIVLVSSLRDGVADGHTNSDGDL